MHGADDDSSKDSGSEAEDRIDPKRQLILKFEMSNIIIPNFSIFSTRFY